jgi:hypothetical protein
MSATQKLSFLTADSGNNALLRPEDSARHLGINISSQGHDLLRAYPPVLMNEKEVAAFIGVCTRSVRNFTSRGNLPVIRLGRRRLYRRDAILAALKKLESGAGIT